MIDVVADPIAKVPVSALADITVPPVPTLRIFVVTVSVASTDVAVIIPVIFTLPFPVIVLPSKLILPSNVVAVIIPVLLTLPRSTDANVDIPDVTYMFDVIKSGSRSSLIVPPIILAPSNKLVAVVEVVALPSNVVAVIIPPCAVIPVPTFNEFVTITSSGNPICGCTFSPDVTDTVTSFVAPKGWSARHGGRLSADVRRGLEGRRAYGIYTRYL